jgi:hypothetical protein
MRRIGLAVVAVFGLLLLAIAPQVQAESEYERRSLVGLKAVYVLVETIDREAEQDGLPRSTLQTDIELKLRQAGIAIHTVEQSARAPGSPYLYLNVAAGKNRAGFYAYHVRLSLEQGVSLIRAPTVTVTGSTWQSNGVIGIVRSGNVAKIRDAVRDVVDEFINAYLAANPTK